MEAWDIMMAASAVFGLSTVLIVSLRAHDSTTVSMQPPFEAASAASEIKEIS